MTELFNTIVKEIKKTSGNNLQAINDLFYLCKNEIEEGDVKLGLHYCSDFKKLLGECIKNETNKHQEELYNKIFDVLVLESRWSFDSYFQALEFNRPIEEQFYLPRRNTLMKHGVIQALEDLIIYDKLDELFLSMPPRVGKTTLTLFVISWIIGYNSELANLYVSNSGGVTEPFYQGVLSILSDDYTYNWKKIFKTTKFNKQTMCNAKTTCLDTGRNKRYHSFTARSIDGALNGACDCNGLLIADDLVNGIEEALNIARLRTLWLKSNNDMLSRAKERAKILWIGTRWSINDPIGIRLDSSELAMKRSRNIVVPALDENDQSNFDYLYGVGFSTSYYRGKRMSYQDSDDMASWSSIYQGQPIEREGMLFIPSQLNLYNVLPKGEPTRKFAYVDVAWGGGDYTVMPIVYQYDNDLYCVDFVCDSGNKKITQPKIVNAIIRYDLKSVKFEKNNGGEEYRDDIDRMLREKGLRITLLTGLASNQMSKETKIFEHAPSIRDIYFLDEKERNDEYRKAMENLCSFTIHGKNRHDDVPDALAGIIDMTNDLVQKNKVEVFQRPF